MDTHVQLVSAAVWRQRAVIRTALSIEAGPTRQVGHRALTSCERASILGHLAQAIELIACLW
jgi:hypothetical protein